MLIAEGRRDPKLLEEPLFFKVSKGDSSAQSSSASRPSPTRAGFCLLRAAELDLCGVNELEEPERDMPLEENRLAGGSLKPVVTGEDGPGDASDEELEALSSGIEIAEGNCFFMLFVW